MNKNDCQQFKTNKTNCNELQDLYISVCTLAELHNKKYDNKYNKYTKYCNEMLLFKFCCLQTNNK